MSFGSSTQTPAVTTLPSQYSNFPSPLSQLGYVPPPAIRSPPPADFKVSPSQINIAQSGSILSTLVAPSSTPSFQSPTEVRSDPILEKLLQYGYVVRSRVYQDRTLTYLLIKTRLGDKFFAKVDQPTGQNIFTNANGIEMTKNQNVVIVPEEIKMGVLQCLNYEVCGAAFVCDGSICFTDKYQRGQESLSFTEENFIYHTQGSDFELSTGILGNSPLPYPIIPLSLVLNQPQDVERTVQATSKELHQLAYRNAIRKLDLFEQQIDQLKRKVGGLRQFLTNSYTGLNSDIDKLETVYSRQTGPTDQILDSLSRKKYFTGRVIQVTESASNETRNVEMINKNINDMVNPTLEKVYPTLGKL